MFKIFTDTSANLSPEIITENSITVVPFTYTLDGETFVADGMNFDGHLFYDKIRAGAEVKTSMVNFSTFSEKMEEVLKEGYDILYIGMSSGISGAYFASTLAKDDMNEQYPDRKIITIDTLAASWAEGLFVLDAIDLRAEGKTIEETENILRAKTPNIFQYFTVDDLKYLKNGGRISAATALVGSLLSIKPILFGDSEGKIVSVAKARGRKASLDMLVKNYSEKITDKNSRIAISQADCPNDAEYLVNELRKAGHNGEIIIGMFESVTGSHVGPGAIALFFFGDKN